MTEKEANMQTASNSSAKSRFLFVVGHDYGSPLRATVHFLIDEFAKLGDVQVFSVGFSELTQLKKNPQRRVGASPFNQVTNINGVDSFVWKALFTPFNMKLSALDMVSRAAFDGYRKAAPAQLFDWAKQADMIFVESGMPALFLKDLAAANPDAKIVYGALDDMKTIGCAPSLIDSLEEAAPLISWAVLPSRKLAPNMPRGIDKYFMPQGVDKSITERADPSPYGDEGKHAVSIGSMLFDLSFFEMATQAFPDVTFHVIGSGKQEEEMPKGVKWYSVLPFEELPAFIKHADFGIAPYRDAKNVDYLCDTSLKLIQYGLFGLPAVCPHFAADNRRLRFGYQPGDAASIENAIAGALAVEDKTPAKTYDWAEIAKQIINPDLVEDALIERRDAAAAA